jgi:hypothetical protein
MASVLNIENPFHLRSYFQFIVSAVPPPSINYSIFIAAGVRFMLVGRFLLVKNTGAERRKPPLGWK